MSQHWLFEIGGKTTTDKEICQLLPPSDQEFGWMLRNLAGLIAAGTSISDGCACVAKTTRHPWLILLLSTLYTAHKGKDRRVGDLQKVLASYAKQQIMQLEEHVARAPNLTGFFHTFLHLLDYAEGEGEVDTMLYRLGDLLEGEETPRQGLLRDQEELGWLLRYVAMLVDFDLPILRTLRLLSQDPRWYMFQSELNQICDSIEEGSTLSQAFQNAQGRLSDPLVVAMVQAGERTGTLVSALTRLTG